MRGHCLAAASQPQFPFSILSATLPQTILFRPTPSRPWFFFRGISSAAPGKIPTPSSLILTLAARTCRWKCECAAPPAGADGGHRPPGAPAWLRGPFRPREAPHLCPSTLGPARRLHSG
eukprot:5936797-Pyramimonas_sp.AAC.2